MTTRHRHGFTLIELLVVISVMAVLISLLLPSLVDARVAAQSVKCAANERQIGMAFFSYANDSSGRIPPVGSAFVIVNGTRGGTFYHWLGKAGYLGAGEPFTGTFGVAATRFAPTQCPGETGGTRFGMIGTFYDLGRMAGSYVLNASVVRTGSGGHNWYLSSDTGGNFTGYYNGPPASKYFRRDFLQGPETILPGSVGPALPASASSAILVIDTPDWGPFWAIPYYNHHIDNPAAPAYDSVYAFRHVRGSLNALYMDGHVAAKKPFWETGQYINQILWTSDVQ